MNITDTDTKPKPFKSLDLLAEAAQLNAQYDTMFPVFQHALSLTLIRRAFQASQSDADPVESLSFWHKLLVENAKLPTPGQKQAAVPQGAELLDLIWDVFSLSADERSRRRALIGEAARVGQAAGGKR